MHVHVCSLCVHVCARLHVWYHLAVRTIVLHWVDEVQCVTLTSLQVDKWTTKFLLEVFLNTNRKDLKECRWLVIVNLISLYGEPTYTSPTQATHGNQTGFDTFVREGVTDEVLYHKVHVLALYCMLDVCTASRASSTCTLYRRRLYFGTPCTVPVPCECFCVLTDITFCLLLLTCSWTAGGKKWGINEGTQWTAWKE